MKLSQFNKAAKRYSAGASLPLHEAQESLATYFGFANYHAAQQSLKDDAAASQAPPPVQGPAFWCDLPLPQFRMLCMAMIKTNSPQYHHNAARAEAVINAGLDYLSVYSSVALRDFILVLSLDSFCTIIESNAGKDDVFDLNNTLPAHIKSIANYIHIGDLGRRWLVDANDANDKMRRRQRERDGDVLHNGAIAYITDKIVQPFAFVEQCGGAGKVKLASGQSLKNCLDLAASNRRVLTAAEGLAILDSINVARVFG